MTMQGKIHFFYYKSNRYPYAKFGTTDFLFDPKDLGIRTKMFHTACYAGYYAGYAITDTSFVLDHLLINLAGGEYAPIPDVYGVQPYKKYLSWAYAIVEYRDINHAYDYNGDITLARGLCEDLLYKCDESVINYSPPLWAYQEGLEFHFKDGKLIGIDDISQECADIRNDQERLEKAVDEHIEYIERKRSNGFYR